jgi:DNA-binding HxlR family transcriptional regulator
VEFGYNKIVMARWSPNYSETEKFCPRYQRAVEIIGRRWSGAILRVLLDGALRFSEIQDAVPDLSNRMLSERLREFEEEGIVERVVLAERPVRVEYRLTDKGSALDGVVKGLSRWAEEWIELDRVDEGTERRTVAS